MNQIHELENRSVDTEDDDQIQSKFYSFFVIILDTFFCLAMTINRDRSANVIEDLSSEIIYEIFDFLDPFHVYKAFSNLNTRFQDLVSSTLTIKVNTSIMSKSAFHDYYEHFIIPNNDRISLLYLFNSFIVNLIIPSPQNITMFPLLETLILNNIDVTCLENLLEHLNSFPKLSSLAINSVDGHCDKNSLYSAIFRVRSLKYCSTSIDNTGAFYPLPIAQNNFSHIEHLVIKNLIYLNELVPLLSYVPELRRLSINCLHRNDKQPPEMFTAILDHLTHVLINVENVEFHQFEPFITNLSRHLEVLRITTNNDDEYLNANRWERIILFHMIHLRIFDIQHTKFLNNTLLDENACQVFVSRFASSFWTERKWFLAHQHKQLRRSKYAIFYSIQPYR